MRVVVNDEHREVPEPATVEDLIKHLGLAGQACAVEVNKRLVPKREHGATGLKDEDRVEIVTLVGGG